MVKKISLDNTISDIKQTIIQVKKLKNSAVLRTLTDLQPDIHNETRWSSKYKMLQKWIRIRSELIEASSHQDSNIEINDSLSYKNCVTKFTKWMKEVDVITIYMKKEYITLEECRSAFDHFTKTVETILKYGKLICIRTN